MKGRAILVATLAAAVGIFVGGCGKTISGTAEPAGAGGGVNTNFDKLLRECKVVQDDQIVKATGAQSTTDSFNGAVCMWDLNGAPGGDAMATLNWYEMGSLTNEKTTNDKLGYSTTNINVQGRRSLEIRRPNDPDSCGVEAPAADTGVIGWWINYHAGAHPDPCAAASKLVGLTLDLAR